MALKVLHQLIKPPAPQSRYGQNRIEFKARTQLFDKWEQGALILNQVDLIHDQCRGDDC